MKFVTNRGSFVPLLERATRATPSRVASTPLLNGVLLEADTGGVRLTTTDLNLSVRSDVTSKTDEPGSTVVPARPLLAICKAMDTELVLLETTEDGLTIRGGSVSAHLHTMIVDDYPAVRRVETDPIRVSSSVWRSAIRQVVYAASTDEGRPVLCGVLMSRTDQGLRFVATDGYRMAIRDVSGISMPDAFDDIIMPSYALKELVRLIPKDRDEDVLIAVDEDCISFAFQETSITSYLIEGIYPDYQQLMPGVYLHEVRLDRRAFLQVLDRMRKAVSDKFTPICLTVRDEEVICLLESPGVVTISDRVLCAHQGDEQRIGFNPRYLSEAFSAVNAEEVVLAFNDHLKPCMVQGIGDDSCRSFVMPVTIGAA